MKNLKLLVPFLLVLLVAAMPSHAQTTTTTTTLSAAIGDTSSSLVVLASGTNVAAGGYLFVDKELMAVIGPNVSGSTTRWTVRRGAGGVVGSHASAAKVYVASPGLMAASVFRNSLPSGSCTAGNEAYLPVIVVPTGEEVTCSAGAWVNNSASRTVTYAQGPTVANAVTTGFFIADKEYVVTGVKGVWGTAETTGSMDIMPEKATGTTACGSATALLSAAIAGTGTANTVATGSLSATAASLHLAVGNRLCMKLSATPNEVKDIVVTVTLAPKL